MRYGSGAFGISPASTGLLLEGVIGEITWVNSRPSSGLVQPWPIWYYNRMSGRHLRVMKDVGEKNESGSLVEAPLGSMTLAHSRRATNKTD